MALRVTLLVTRCGCRTCVPVGLLNPLLLTLSPLLRLLLPTAHGVPRLLGDLP